MQVNLSLPHNAPPVKHFKIRNKKDISDGLEEFLKLPPVSQL